MPSNGRSRSTISNPMFAGNLSGEEDEDESDGEEPAEKSFVWENAARPHLQGLGHSHAGRDERGEEGDNEQSIVDS